MRNKTNSPNHPLIHKAKRKNKVVKFSIKRFHKYIKYQNSEEKKKNIGDSGNVVIHLFVTTNVNSC